LRGYRISTGSAPCNTVEGCIMAMPQRGDPPPPSLPPSHLHAPPSYTYCNMCRTVCGWGTTKRKAWYNTPMNSKDEIQERMADDVCITVSLWRRFRRRKENNADANFKCT
jgi:hypothetical protein